MNNWKIRREYHTEYHRKWRRENPEKALLSSARHHAKERNVPFNLELEDIVIPEKCPVFGVTLEQPEKYKGPHSPSLDRIIPELGYVKGNVQVLSLRANMMKNDANPEELKKFANWVVV